MRTDGVHCRESAGTGPVGLKVIRVTNGCTINNDIIPVLTTYLPLHPRVRHHNLQYVVRGVLESIQNLDATKPSEHPPDRGGK